MSEPGWDHSERVVGEDDESLVDDEEPEPQQVEGELREYEDEVEEDRGYPA